SRTSMAPAIASDALAQRNGGLQMDVELREPSERFAAAVSERGGSLVQEEGPRYRFAFATLSSEAASGATPLPFEAARETGAQVRRFHPAKRSLEDIFMEAMK